MRAIIFYLFKPFLGCLVTASISLFVGSAFGSSLPSGLIMEESYAPGEGAPVGEIILAQGDVIIVHGDKKKGYKALKGLSLYKGDFIYTLEKGRVRFELNDGSILTLASNTDININESIFLPKKKSRSSFLRMGIGKARFVVKELGGYKRSDFKVKTKTAIVGVRGSDYIIIATRTRTEVTALKKTRLKVVSLVGPEEPTTELMDFQQTIIEEGKLATEPWDIPEADTVIMLKDFIFGDEADKRGDARPPEATRKKIIVSEDDLARPADEDRPPVGRAGDEPPITDGPGNSPDGVIDDQEDISERQREREIRPGAGELPPFPHTPDRPPSGSGGGSTGTL